MRSLYLSSSYLPVETEEGMCLMPIISSVETEWTNEQWESWAVKTRAAQAEKEMVELGLDLKAVKAAGSATVAKKFNSFVEVGF